jgi:excinuclease ABC subunit C
MNTFRQYETAFDPAAPRAALASLPEQAAVFALYGDDERAEPYVGRTSNLRARLERLLLPSAKHPKRLQLAGLVKKICWRPVGSEFEALLEQFTLLHSIYGDKASKRMHLRAPYFIRYIGSNRYPHIAVTNRPIPLRSNPRDREWAFGPFASRAAAERFAEETLKLFLLRRCTGDLPPDPNYAGCIYSEMKMCLAPCFVGCSDERYAQEAEAVHGFLATRGESQLVQLRAQRDEASAALDFESAAALHAQALKVESVRALASELVRPLSQLRAVIVQPAAEAGHAALFLYDAGKFTGPLTIAARRASVDLPEAENGEPDAEPESAAAPTAAEIRKARKLQEEQLNALLVAMVEESKAPTALAPQTVRQAHLALLKRWYYRPEARRVGEIFFLDAEGLWPVKAILRGVNRTAAAGADETAAPANPAG